MSESAIPGYTMGTEQLPRSPVRLEDFELLKRTVLFNDEDVKYLRLSREVLADQIDAVLDVWYGFIAANPFLLRFFTRKSDSQPDQAYLARVRQRFAQWILDTAAANYGQQWLDYQHEIGRRHYQEKNKTDNVDSVELVSFRYLIPLIYPITATLKPFLAKKGHDRETIDKMYRAWLKSLLLQIALWSQPYVREGAY